MEINPDRAAVVQEAARRVIAGEAINAVCRDFESRGVPSPADSYNKRKAERDFVWHPATLKKILSSPGLLGFKTRNEPVAGKKYQSKVLVQDENGQRIRMAEPVLAEEVRERLQGALAAVSVSTRKPDSPRTPLLGVIKCGGCGKNLQLHTTKKKRKDGSERSTSRIRCLSRTGSPACKGYVFTPEAEIVEPIMRLIVAEFGHLPVTRREYVTGTDTDHWDYLETGLSFAERWQSAGVTAVADDLLRAGISVDCHPRGSSGLTLRAPGDAQQRLARP
ncbi:zinc ribbon domain-containing protein [Streptomyces sp. MZ04]|uniref:recombinase family protein n=1 Tax=Streptomyces sp. MZ04 TaxID=2559236 RepID=UPI00107EC74B|nr:zinc ribbon domain-containing protein [Streptomyces sp. MZ04]TGB05978.1 recombinase family protein [Streptomyces sp. MZ04]